jgi:hypothetical protein
MDLMDTLKIEQLLEKIVDRLDSLLSKVGDIERETRLGGSSLTSSLTTIEFHLSNIENGIDSLDWDK